MALDCVIDKTTLFFLEEVENILANKVLSNDTTNVALLKFKQK